MHMFESDIWINNFDIFTIWDRTYKQTKKDLMLQEIILFYFTILQEIV
jgi:hypothetical protein